MPQKILHVEGVGELPFYKRRGARNVRIRINGNDVRITMPNWMPYKAALLYVLQRVDWINQHRKTKHLLADGVQIGKRHSLHIAHGSGNRISGRILPEKINVKVPIDATIESAVVQKKLELYTRRALMIEAEELILPRVRQFAERFHFSVGKIEIKNLRSRWGSCSSKQDLAFSLFLIQLPWEVIDYVIIHELAHTVHMNHSKDFWQLVEVHQPQYRELRRTLKQYSPDIITT